MKKKDLLTMIQQANSRIQSLERRIAFLEDSILVAQQTPSYTPPPATTPSYTPPHATPSYGFAPTTAPAPVDEYVLKHRRYILDNPADLPKGLVAPFYRP